MQLLLEIIWWAWAQVWCKGWPITAHHRVHDRGKDLTPMVPAITCYFGISSFICFILPPLSAVCSCLKASINISIKVVTGLRWLWFVHWGLAWQGWKYVENLQGCSEQFYLKRLLFYSCHKTDWAWPWFCLIKFYLWDKIFSKLWMVETATAQMAHRYWIQWNPSWGTAYEGGLK